jgi:Gas vesicle protein
MSIPPRSPARASQSLSGREPAQLADVLERVLDKGIVIVGDIRINLLDIELLTVKLRLLVASADKAREMGIDWWEGDRFLTRGSDHELIDRVKRLERAAGLEDGNARARGGEDARSK